MSLRALTTACLAALMFFGFAAASVAETYKISMGKGVGFVTYPDSWKVDTIKRGVEGLTKGQEVVLWVEAFTPEQFDTLWGEHEEYFKEQKITFSGKPESMAVDFKGVKLTIFKMNAKYKGAKTDVQYAIMDPGMPNGAKLILTSWASPEDSKKFEKQMDAILESIKFQK